MRYVYRFLHSEDELHVCTARDVQGTSENIILRRAGRGQVASASRRMAQLIFYVGDPYNLRASGAPVSICRGAYFISLFRRFPEIRRGTCVDKTTTIDLWHSPKLFERKPQYRVGGGVGIRVLGDPP